MRRVAITAMATASPFGTNEEDLWRGLCEGPNRATRFVSPSFPELDACVSRLPEGILPEGAETHAERASGLLRHLVRRTLDAAFLERPSRGTALSIGSVWSEWDSYGRPRAPMPAPLLSNTARELRFTGPVASTPIGCAASNYALGWALDLVACGTVPSAIAGGIDVIGVTAIAMFELFGNLTPTTPRPFAKDRDGFLLAEGGAMFFLEPLEDAERAGRPVLAELCAMASAHDSVHPTRPAADGDGLRRAIERALYEAKLSPERIGYVNAHSPGTDANDEGEAAALRAVFGPRGVPVGSTKGALGHAQGAANALEAAACVLALQRQAIPPTLNTLEVAPTLDLDVVLREPRSARLDYALSTGSGMGGGNAVVILGKRGASACA